MQQIVNVAWSPEEYASAEVEQQMGKPAVCPNCRKSRSLEAHGKVDLRELHSGSFLTINQSYSVTLFEVAFVYVTSDPIPLDKYPLLTVNP